MKSKIFESNVTGFENYEAEWITMDKVEAKNQPWFWPGMIPADTLTLFAGHGGVGKSLLLLYLMAKTTTGDSFIAGGIEHQLLKGSVILLSAEDDKEYQIKPKLIASQADYKKVHFLISKISTISKESKLIELDKDIYLLEQRIKEVGDVKLIVIDPIAYFLGEIRDNHNPEVANFLQKLIWMAKKYGIAIILNKHLRKQGANSKGISLAVDEVGGAGAWTNSPRRCLLITDHPEDNEIKVITKMKDNLGKKEKEVLGYKIEKTTVDKVDTTSIVWLQEMQKITAEEAMNEETYHKSKQQEVIDYIFNYLKKHGKSRLAVITEMALQNGTSIRTFRRACREIEEDYKDVIQITKGIKGSKIYQILENT